MLFYIASWAYRELVCPNLSKIARIFSFLCLFCSLQILNAQVIIVIDDLIPYQEGPDGVEYIELSAVEDEFFRLSDFELEPNVIPSLYYFTIYTDRGTASQSMQVIGRE